MAKVQVQQVSKVYGTDAKVQAVLDVSLSVISGEFVALMGPSGCGKSTLLNLIGAIDTPSQGSIEIDGIHLPTLGEPRLTYFRRDQLGFIFQFFNLLPTLTVEENVALPLGLAGKISAQEMKRRVKALLEQVNLAHRMPFYPSQLSGGEMQRVAIARALIHQPKLIIADEPTGNLDTENGRQILELLKTLSVQQGQTIIMATHSPEAAEYASRLIKMRDGRIEADTGSHIQ